MTNRAQSLNMIEVDTMRLAIREFLRPLYRTQEDMAKALGSTQSAVSNMLNPRMLRPIPYDVASTASMLLGYANVAACVKDLDTLPNPAMEEAKQRYAEFGSGVWAIVHDMMHLRPLRICTPESLRVLAVVAKSAYVVDDNKAA